MVGRSSDSKQTFFYGWPHVYFTLNVFTDWAETSLAANIQIYNGS